MCDKKITLYYFMTLKEKRNVIKICEKTNRSFRSPADVLEKAAKLVTEEGFSYRKAAASFGIDKMTEEVY